MKRHSCFFLALLLFASCDDGLVYNEIRAGNAEGFSVKLTGDIRGIGSWADGYNVVLAGFRQGENYAATAKNIQPGESLVTLNNVPKDVATVELCVIDRVRYRVATFAEFPATNARDTLDVAVGDVDASMFAAVQSAVFTPHCARCHGLGNSAAAGLRLNEGQAFDAIVGKPSKKVEGWQLVEPGNAEESVLYQAIATDVSSNWGMIHSDILIDKDKQTLIQRWISTLKDE